MHRPLALAALVTLSLTSAGVAQDHDHRLHTTRSGKHLLELPKEEDAFGFVVFGDRTGGPAEGIEVLKQAVADTNLLDPDLVLTVGDLVQGYNRTEEWLVQMREFKDVMSKLRMPWFPVAGNHDIYWRGEGKPEGEHEQSYETHFGPLWYALEHKNCWFIALYSDEGDPETGTKNFNDPKAQRMSPEQFAWLQATLAKAKDAAHVFLFLHHPRWLAQYGDDWEKVHAALAKNGNVRAVFAGHIHRMRYDGVRDGVEYFALATTGGHQSRDIPEAGYLHHFNVVTVRPEGITVATLPVGTVLDPRQITGEVSDDIARLDSGLRPTNLRGLVLDAAFGASGVMQLDLQNPSRRPIELTLEPHAGPGWSFRPDHNHVVVPAGESSTLAFFAVREPSPPEELDLPRLRVQCDYLADGARIALPEKDHELQLPPPTVLATPAKDVSGALVLDGSGDCLRLHSAAAELPDGPVTLETWLQATDFTGRRGLCSKAEDSEYGLFVSDGKPVFSIHIGGRYVDASAAEPVLEPGRWHHVAGVFDGEEVRLYVDGELCATEPGSGARTRNRLPFYVGADTGGRGQAVSFFAGLIDELRLSSAARYSGQRFEPASRFESDSDTALLLHLDESFGPWARDASGRGAHPRRLGNATISPR